MTSTELRLWTVDEYHRMIETGILTTDDRVELLEGQIIHMSPQYPPHAATTQWAANYLTSLLVGQAYIRVQFPITLAPNSEPEPDIAVVRLDRRGYFDHHPAPDEIFLLIEVADSTLKKDRALKAAVYARAKIPEYWILDIQQRQVYVFRLPGTEIYQQEAVFNEDATISLLAFPDVNVCINQLFP